MFEFVLDPLPGLLEFADTVYQSFDVPFISLDIGFDGTAFSLIEFQFLRFGTKTTEHSPCCFLHDGAAWRRVDEVASLEREYATGLASYVRRLEARRSRS